MLYMSIVSMPLLMILAVVDDGVTAMLQGAQSNYVTVMIAWHT